MWKKYSYLDMVMNANICMYIMHLTPLEEVTIDTTAAENTGILFHQWYENDG